jgi:hypothetical protein
VGVNEASARNRDGNVFAIGVSQTLPLPVEWPYGQVEVTGGYQFESYAARGTEYSYRAHELAGTVRADLPWRFSLEVAGGFAWRPYRHPTTFPNPPIFAGVPYTLPSSDRHETTGVAGVALERALSDWLAVGVSWRYERNVSNADAFDYEREIVGAYLTATLGN